MFSSVDFILGSGIAEQLDAFRSGFCKVFDIEQLQIFTPDEVMWRQYFHDKMLIRAQLLVVICGEQDAQWTHEDLMNYTEPRYGFTKESPTFIQFVNVLATFPPAAKKAS